MIKKLFPYFNIVLSSIMLFIAMPNLSASAVASGELFWLVWTILCLLIMAANGNFLLMSKEKKQRLKQIRRMRKIKQEQLLVNMLNRGKGKTKEKKKERVNQAG